MIAFVQSTGTPWKRFDGNSPAVRKRKRRRHDHIVSIGGGRLWAEPGVLNNTTAILDFGRRLTFHQKWTFEVPKSGHLNKVEFDFACDDSTAGSLNQRTAPAAGCCPLESPAVAHGITIKHGRRDN